MFDIEIKYTTGNSFGSHEETDRLDLPTANIEFAKENLRRIAEHYKVYRDKGLFHRKHEEIVYPYFYIRKNKDWGSGEIDGIILVTDIGNHRMLSPFWIGYFETLIEIKIIIVDEDSDKFVVTF